jgi:hypothetical protein
VAKGGSRPKYCSQGAELNRRVAFESKYCGGAYMPSTGWSPNIVPYGADETVYLVVDSFQSGTAYRETEVERADLETIINDLLSGQFNYPVRVVSFNTLEHWAKDVSCDIASEISARCDIDGLPVPEHLSDFVDRNTRSARQLALRLV